MASPPRFSLERAGDCSFCSQASSALRSLVGVEGRATRICSECVGLGMEMVALEDSMGLPGGEEGAGPRESEGLTRALQALGTDPKGVERGIAAVQGLFGGRAQPGSRDPHACSFCDTARPEAAQLIAGPGVFVCELCLEEAAVTIREASR
jgi:hypothetical protein